MNYFCCEEGRRSLVRAHATLNGIDHLEVVHHEEPTLDEQQRRLRVFFVKAPDATLAARFPSNTPDEREANSAKVHVTGGGRVQHIQVDGATWKPATPSLSEHLEIHVTPRGDYSRYTLSLVEPGSDNPLHELDPVLSRLDFSFKVECETEFDCKPACVCPPVSVSSPVLDYLAKDYASFRQLMLDRLTLLAPAWRERNPADLGIALVELLAYVGDYLSYRQDAIGTEAYLGTARRRVSVRRHTRWLDYVMHDGSNARTWVQMRVNSSAAGGVVIPLSYFVNAQNQFLEEAHTALMVATQANAILRRPRFVTRLAADPVLAEHEFQRLAGATSVDVFEPLERADLFPEHNQMFFHTWGDDVCCLPKGATKAVLRGHFPNLRPGNVLVFVERIGPKTGDLADADPTRRYAVRLTKVNGLDSAKYAQREGELEEACRQNQKNNMPPPNRDDFFPVRQDLVLAPPQSVTEIEWAEADAPPFPFCISARTENGQRLLTNVSVALGNIVLTDHGSTLLTEEPLTEVPSPDPVLAPVSTTPSGHCDAPERLTTAPRYRPSLKEMPVTQAAPYDPTRPAIEATRVKPGAALPAIALADDQEQPWRSKRDLLSSDAFAPEFVLEVENDGRAFLRFGDDENGMAPGEGTRFDAIYRVGNGAGGNIGAEALVHLVGDFVLVPGNSGQLLPRSPAGLIEAVTNPLAARGGTDPESLEQARQNAPAAFRVQQRAVTPADCEQKASEHPDVQRAVATVRWTGSWHTIFLTVDRRGGRPVDTKFEEELRRFLEHYRMAGQDLEINGPRYVPLELELRVCVASDYFRGDVVAALQTVFDNRLHADSTRGFFHPDNFTFGQPVLLSRIYAEAQKVAGVRHVEVTRLRRQGDTTGEDVPEADVFTVGRLEVVRLDNDPNFPDHGVLRFNPVGGR